MLSHPVESIPERREFTRLELLRFNAVQVRLSTRIPAVLGLATASSWSPEVSVTRAQRPPHTGLIAVTQFLVAIAWLGHHGANP